MQLALLAEDFPQKWPDLLTEMVNRFQSGDFHVINGVLRTAHSLFKDTVMNLSQTSYGLKLNLFWMPLPCL